MPKNYQFEPIEAEYAGLLKRMLVLPGRASAIERVAQRIVANRARYEAVEATTGVPWAFIGALHYREIDGDFRGVLHNGERILGTGRRTRLVPAGRGPFSTWEEAAEDALNIKNLSAVPDWSLERICFEGERFNGFGYRMRGIRSPYLWQGTNLAQRGKFVRDHVWDPAFSDPQLGVMPIYIRVLDIAPQASKKVAGMSLGSVGKVKSTLKGLGATVGTWFTLDNAGVAKGWAETTGVNVTALLAVFLGAAALWTVLSVLETKENPDDSVDESQPK